MKSQTVIIAILVISSIIMVAWLPCQAGDNAIYGCANKKNGRIRHFSIYPLTCLTAEYPVTLYGTIGTVEKIGQLACVTARPGISEDSGGLEVSIAYQKNITITDWNEVFDLFGGPKFGLSCKNEWIMVSCTQDKSDEVPVDIDIKDVGCFRDATVNPYGASIYVTCCKIM